jgi:HSP20 family protein
MSDQQPATAAGDQQGSAAPARAEAVSDAPSLVPPTDVVETRDALMMLLDVPGADPDSLDVTLDKRTLRVWARSTSTAPQGYALVHAEYRDGNYERAFTLSEQVDSERVDAVFKDGVLRLTLAKAGPSPAKKIEVKAA